MMRRANKNNNHAYRTKPILKLQWILTLLCFSYYIHNDIYDNLMTEIFTRKAVFFMRFVLLAKEKLHE